MTIMSAKEEGRIYDFTEKPANPKTVHDVVLNSREQLYINGVKEIINFDENNINLKTVMGELSIEGENIHINVLNIEKGEIRL